MKTRIFNLLIQRYRDGSATADERQLVDRWYEQLDREQLPEKSISENLQHRIYGEICSHIDGATVRQVGSMISWKFVVSIAASLFICLGVMWWMTAQDQIPLQHMVADPEIRVFETIAGERKQVILPDSSVITLNSMTRLKLDVASFNKTNRQLELSYGEAFFDVRRDTLRPFIVTSGALQTQVLGTSFTIRSYTDLPEQTVAVFSGRVQVKRNDQMLGILIKGQQIRYDKSNENSTTESFDLENRNAWITGKTYLNKASFEELALTIRNNYGVTLQTTNTRIADQQYTLSIQKQISLEDLLEVITTVHHNKFRKEGDVVMIY
ncbi:FecR family protein [Sphingobacterium spiritivorum]